ncbi:tetratricopeptide repeat protein [Spirillospora sp. CA-294931]|uniref:tetratricopeptide repeat protein n=1 Tax=Spirillospora sp. CA-294931 TaxID=3240042 RepID=UPI003D8E5CFD
MTLGPLRIFVAMPGSSMGEEARWRDISMIKAKLLEPVAEEIGRRVSRTPVLVIEKDKTSTGGIYSSMYGEAIHAEVYIADLTGANPNVYLELGVRWALKDSVTVPIAQDLNEVKFNVSAARVIPYGPMPDELDTAKQQIVAATVDGLANAKRIDSPVRENLPLVSIPRDELNALHAENQRLKDERGEDLVAAGRATESPHQRIEFFRRAIERNPANVDAYLELGVELRKAGRYHKAADVLRRATRVDEEHAAACRELGVTLSKGSRLEEAVKVLERAVQLDESDAEAWSNLGGALRRLARQGSGMFDRDRLQRAKHAYDRAARLSGNEVYPLMNAARIGLLLGAENQSDHTEALARFARLVHLTHYAVEESERSDPWKLFDLADTLALTGEGDAAVTAAQDGIALIQPEHRASYLSSVLEPLDDLLDAVAFDKKHAANLVRLRDIYSDVLNLTEHERPADEPHTT